VIRRAAKVDANQAEIVAALRKVGCEVVSTAAIGNGFPDLIVLGPGMNKWERKIYLVEIKNGSLPPSRRRLTAFQKVLHKIWPVHVVTNWAEALNVVAWRNPNLGTNMPNEGTT